MLEKDGEDQLDRSCEKLSISRVKEKRNTLHTTKRRNANWIGHTFGRNCLLKHIIPKTIDEEIEATERQERRRKQPLDDLTETTGY
jgi:hypothetical protein